VNLGSDVTKIMDSTRTVTVFVECEVMWCIRWH